MAMSRARGSTLASGTAIPQAVCICLTARPASVHFRKYHQRLACRVSQRNALVVNSIDFATYVPIIQSAVAGRPLLPSRRSATARWNNMGILPLTRLRDGKLADIENARSSRRTCDCFELCQNGLPLPSIVFITPSDGCACLLSACLTRDCE